MPSEIYFNHPVAKAIFTFTQAQAPLPPGTKSLLSLGLKFCIHHRKLTNNIKKSIERVSAWRYGWKRMWKTTIGISIPNSILKIQCGFPRKPVTKSKRPSRIKTFAQRITDMHNKHQQSTTPKNLSYLQNQALNMLVEHPNVFVCPADKNMGIALWLRHTGTKKILAEHLSNNQVYQNITHQIQAKKAELKYRWYNFIDTHARFLPDKVWMFLDRSKMTHGFKRIAPFRATCKMHKNPVMFRPVVAKCSTILEAISKWLDVELLKISKAYLKETWHLQHSS